MKNIEEIGIMSCMEPCQVVTVCDPCNKCGKRKRYVQPPRQQMIRPQQYLTFPADKMDAGTVYKESFQCIDSNTVKNCRSAPFRPLNLLRTNPESLSKDTVTKLSFPVFCNVERRKPIIPNPPSLLGEGPMQSLTTQRHDFVSKLCPIIPPIRPREHFPRSTCPLENVTTQKLSFLPPCGFDKAESFKPVSVYQPPTIPMERETTQRLSFLPYCPPKKERLPWAERPNYCKPMLPMDMNTTQKQSFMPPGCFIDDCCCCCQMESNDGMNMAPTAAIC